MISYKEFKLEKYLEQVKEILTLEGWNAYLNDDTKLLRAFDNSLLVYGAFDENKLVGYIRVVGDGEHVVVVQDLIVRKEYQHQKIGTNLFKYSWDKYVNCRMFNVITDINDEVANKFYQSFNMKKLEQGQMISYFR